MALQASGPISFSQISNEFGLPPNKNMGAYRVSQTVGELSNLPLDTGVPQSGIVRFSNFYSKKLNVVVNCGNGSRINARTLYNNNSVGITSVIGGYKTRPESSSETKVWIHVTGTITFGNTTYLNNRYCSLLTGSWDSNTDLTLDIASSGSVMGRGGRGGNGGTRPTNTTSTASNGFSGASGTSAIGISYLPIVITNRGTILAGYGGGGGGGAGRRGTVAPLYVGGGGGGGGRPDGSGGSGGGGSASGGGSATTTTQGNGGNGGTASGDPAGGGETRTITGGKGGSSGSGGSATIGGNVDEPVTKSLGSGGPAGVRGYAIVVSGAETGVTITPGGSISGTIIYNSTPN